MAILPMEKMTLIAHADSKQQLLKTFQQMGKVEVISCDVSEVSLACAPESLSRLEERLSGLREALEIIRPCDESKQSFLTPKPPMTRGQLENMPERFAEADELIGKIQRFSADMSASKAQRQRLRNRIAMLEPYAHFDAPLESVGRGRYTQSLLGVIPADGMDAYNEIREKYADSAYFEDLGASGRSKPIFVVMAHSVHEQLIGELKYIGMTEAYIKELTGTPKDIIAEAQNEIDRLESQEKVLIDTAKELAAQKAVLLALEDYLLNEIAREKCFERLSETQSAFVMEGWIVAEDREKVKSAVLETAPEAYITLRAPLDDETPPTFIRNKKLVEPFEAVTEMYSFPSPRELDPNPVMCIFYFLLFGMMIGDAAYGVILSIGAFVVLKLKKPTGMFRKVTTIVMYCGISTMLWGLFFGTIFSIEGIPAVINPIGDAMKLLILCLGMGILHITVGLVVAAYSNFRRGRPLDALFDNISWIMVLLGGVLLALGGTAATVGTYTALAGLVIVFLTNGRDRKGIFRKLIGGFSGLYGVTGYLSDILSYCRLFGMGLATGVIAMVFNTIASLFFGNVVGYIVAVIVLTVGHVFNIAINALGAFVHTARLQFIEFYSRFYEGGGRAFSPLVYSTRHFRLED